MGPCDLDVMLASLPRATPEFARLLDTRDDAAVIDLGDGRCLVQTVDFFPPIVDSGYWFGQIAAANALSDVYAMGASPLTALNLVAWPAGLSPETLADVLRGGAEKVAEAGATLAGGHSIDDREPKFGLAVTGIAALDEIVYNSGARAGDRLVLTKRLGIGVLATALKRGLITEDDMMPAIEEAAALSSAAVAAMKVAGAHACTDVTGFGLLGHLREMLEASGLAAEVFVEDVPVRAEVHDLIREGVYAGGLSANRDYLVSHVSGRALGEPATLALVDPQTSGGLLVAVAPENLERLLAELEERGAHGWAIGQVVHGPVGEMALL
ncbi:MAG: selenide, water dikinase SelD [Thermoleophilia bacterium]